MAHAAVRITVVVSLLFASTLALERAARHAYHACKPNAQVAEWALAWRVGGPAWRDLETFAKTIEQVVPTGSTVAFRAVPAEHAVAWRAAYLLPQLDIRPVGPGDDLGQVGYAAVFRGEQQDHRLTLVAAHPLGHVYRVVRDP